ncbi:hypothetical protein ACW7EJ_05020, partial [Acinetobacter soli]
VEPLMPFADQSERVAAAALQSCYFLDRFEEAIDLAKRLERSNSLTAQLREYYAYNLRAVSPYTHLIIFAWRRAAHILLHECTYWSNSPELEHLLLC